MSKLLKSLFQVIFSLALGFLLIWFIYKDLTEEDKQNIITSFRQADYIWIVVMAVFALLSHLSRAYRWQYALKPVGVEVGFWSRFHTVMIGYLANLAFPRLGEVTRCGVLARYKKQPFEKIFGTVVAERLVDLAFLSTLMVIAILYQLPILKDFLVETFGPVMQKTGTVVVLGILGVIGLVLAVFTWRWVKSSEMEMIMKVRDKLEGFGDGIATLRTMPDKGWFYAHTVFIWVMYYLMFAITFYSLPATEGVPVGGILAAFVLGGLSIVAVQGGLGAYPLAIMFILNLYGVDEITGYAFGWIVWSAQTALIILVGFFSLIAMPISHQLSEKHAATS